MSVPVAMIAAVAENGVIGAGGKIPWRIPSDSAFFKRMTTGKPLIMGRKTFESIGKALPGRTSIVVSQRADGELAGVIVVASIAEAVRRGQAIAEEAGADEVMVGGGAKIYAEGMALADRLYVTHVALAPEGDTYFPPIDPSVWAMVRTVPVAADPRDTAEFRINVYERHNPDQR